MGQPSRDSQEWVPDAILDIIKTKRIVEDPEGFDETDARQVLRNAAPAAARSIAWLSLHSNIEQVRMRASQYILDGVLGGAFAANAGGQDDALMNLVNMLAANDPIQQHSGK